MTKKSKPGLNPVTAERSLCPISIGMDVFGDKWTMIILRDMLLGKSRYNEFLEGPENIQTNILASRLKKLEQLGFVDRVLYQERPKRYQYVLKQRGRDMIPILHEVSKWSMKHSPGCWQPPERFWQLKP